MRPEWADRRGAMQAGLVVGAGVLLTTWPVAAHPAWVPFAPGSRFTDLLVSHWPYVNFLRVSLAQFGQVPLWNPLILGGMPFAADPLAGLWYPPNWLLAWLPLPFGFNLLWLAHLAWGGLGAWALLRALGAGQGPAVFGALTFAGMPKLVAHIGAGHVSLVYAVAWTPWTLLAARKAARAGGWTAGALAGAAAAVTTLADVRWGAYTAAAAGAYWLACLPRPRLRPATNAPGPSGALQALAACIGLAALLVAGLALPLVELIPYTSRTGLTLDEAGLYSLPWVYLLGLVIPPLGGFHEWQTYLGVLPLLVALPGLRRGNAFWAGLAIVAAALALGTFFVVYPLAYRLFPGMGWLRVPARAWFLVGLAVAVLAGLGAEWLQQRGLPRLAARWGRPGLSGWAAWLVPGLAVLTVLDLARVNGTLVQMQPAPPPAPAATWIRATPTGGRFRVFSPSYSLPAGDGLEHLDGVSPLQIAVVARAINAAAGTPAPGYSVPVPPLEGDVATANAQAVPDARALGLFNVAYVAAEYPLSAAGLELVATFARTRVYRNDEARPRAWVEGPDGAVPATIGRWSPNAIEVRAAGPGVLVASEIAYPGWVARVDGQQLPVGTVHGVLRGVELGPGEHTVRLEYRPRSVYLGAALSGLGWLALLGLGLWQRRVRPR